MLTSCHVDRPADVLTIQWSLLHSQTLVWKHLQDPAKLPEWLGQPKMFNARVGGEIIVDHDDGYLCRSEVLSLTDDDGPPHTGGAELSWEFPDEPPSHLSLRTFDADAHAGHNVATALVLEHSDLGSLVDSYMNGWLTHLTYFEASLWGTPLPPGRFWSLCATFEQLRESARDSHLLEVQTDSLTWSSDLDH